MLVRHLNSEFSLLSALSKQDISALPTIQQKKKKQTKLLQNIMQQFYSIKRFIRTIELVSTAWYQGNIYQTNTEFILLGLSLVLPHSISLTGPVTWLYFFV